ncbi:hypothetical protein, partial [Plasmodium yoelii yoelii]
CSLKMLIEKCVLENHKPSLECFLQM